MRPKRLLDPNLARYMGIANILGAAEVAELAGIDRRTVWRFPRIRLEKVVRIATALKCSPADLMGPGWEVPDTAAYERYLRAPNRRAKGPDPLKTKARSAVANALLEGRLERLPCASCGALPEKVNGRNRIEAHHHRGYGPENWLDVQWLCFECHLESHRKEGQTDG